MGLKLLVTIHSVGNTKGMLSTAISTMSPIDTHRRRWRAVSRSELSSRRPVTTARVSTASVFSSTSVLMEHPPLPGLPLHQRQHQHDEEQQYRDRARVAEVVEAERLLVQVVDEHGGRVARPAARED